jgi:hypothetical protein
MARSERTHMFMWVVSGTSEAKYQNVSCAVDAWGYLVMRFGLEGVDQVGKLDGVLDEE